jgi:hypothetical protein
MPVVPSPVVSLPCGATKMTRGEIELPEQESAARRRRERRDIIWDLMRYPPQCMYGL